MSLPPLPEPIFRYYNWQTESSLPSYSADQMCEYGQQCREAALLEACEHLRAFGFPGAASEVESLKGADTNRTLAFAPFDARDDLK